MWTMCALYGVGCVIGRSCKRVRHQLDHAMWREVASMRGVMRTLKVTTRLHNDVVFFIMVAKYKLIAEYCEV